MWGCRALQCPAQHPPACSAGIADAALASGTQLVTAGRDGQLLLLGGLDAGALRPYAVVTLRNGGGSPAPLTRVACSAASGLLMAGACRGVDAAHWLLDWVDPQRTPPPHPPFLRTGDKTGHLHVHQLPSLHEGPSGGSHAVFEGEAVTALDMSVAPPQWLQVVEEPGSERHLVAAGAESGALALLSWAPSAGMQLVCTLCNHSATLTAARFAAGGARLATAGRDGRVLLYSVHSSSGSGLQLLSQVALGPKAAVVDLQCSADVVVGAGRDGQLCMWRASDGGAVGTS